MSQIKSSLTIAVTFAVCALSGCGDANKQAVFPHQTGWQTTHKTAGSANSATCVECHGENLDGGIAKVSCTSCHLGGALTIHPTSMIPALTKHKAYVNVNDTLACANATCHGTTLGGVTGSGPSCTSCHLGGPKAVHPTPWTSADHKAYVNANGTSACSNVACHGTTLAGVTGSGPSCSSCHLGGPRSVHPTPWTYADHKAYVEQNGSASCKTSACHGVGGVGGPNNKPPACNTCHSMK